MLSRVFHSLVVIAFAIYGSAQTISLGCLTDEEAVSFMNGAGVGDDRKDFGGPYSEGYYNDFTLPPNTGNCQRIDNISVTFNITSIDDSGIAASGCGLGQYYINIYLGCPYGGPGTCPTSMVLFEQGFNDPFSIMNNFSFNFPWPSPITDGFNEVFGFDVVPVIGGGSQGGACSVITNGDITIDYTVCVDITFADLPDIVVAATADETAVCLGGALQLNETSGLGTSWSWDGPNSFSATGQSPTRSPITSADYGTYNVTVTDANGCTGMSSVSITQGASPLIDVTASDLMACIGGDFTIIETGGFANQWSWTGPAGFTSANQSNTLTNITAAQLGMYNVTITDVDGCTNTSIVNVSQAPDPNVVASSTGQFCEGETIELLEIGGDAIMWSWTGPAGFTSNLQNPTITNSTSMNEGNYVVTGTNIFGCTNTGMININLLDNPAADAEVLGGLICYDDDLQFDEIGGDGSMWEWSGPNGFTSMIQNPTISNVTSANNGTYTVTVTDIFGCSSTDQVSVNSIFDITATAVANATTLCEGETLLLDELGGDAASWDWDGPDGFVSSVPSPFISGVDGFNDGIYTVTITDVFGCTASSSVTISVDPAPSVCMSGNLQVICEGECNNSEGVTFNFGDPTQQYNVTLSFTDPSISNITITNISNGETFFFCFDDSASSTSISGTTITIPSGGLSDGDAFFAQILGATNTNNSACNSTIAISCEVEFQYVAETALTIEENGVAILNNQQFICEAELTPSIDVMGVTGSWQVNGSTVSLPIDLTPYEGSTILLAFIPDFGQCAAQVSVNIEIIGCDCSNGATSVQTCNDGNDCTVNDEQTVLDSDGTICVPCAGTPLDCMTGSTILVTCDDGDASTINDMQSVLACDGVTICSTCAGVPGDCSTGSTSIVTCDDGNDCTINDEQTVLDSDGTICVPCSGTALDCMTGSTMMVACDDGIANTINDMQTVLSCDGTTICEPCMGTPTDCSSGTTSIVTCDDGNDCTINDEQTVLDSDGTICVPCAGTALDCITGMTIMVTCDDGDGSTINDMQSVLACDGVTVCGPCIGTMTDCSTGTTSIVSCDDGNDCTINDEQTVLDSDGTICVPCAGTALDCITGSTMMVSCDDGDGSTINDMQSVLECDGVTVCGPCMGTTGDCNTGSTSIVTCDDGNDCTINDEQTVLDSDGTICVPCSGTALDCMTGSTIMVSCDDGDNNTTNDMQSVLACDGVTVCGPCTGSPVDCSTGSTSIVTCDDVNDCTINDEQTILDSDGTICIPCAGVPLDCMTGNTITVSCDDGDSNTTNDMQSVLACDGVTVCGPCTGSPVDCSTGSTSIVTCDDGNDCTINDEQTILDSDGTICVPCAGTALDCSTGMTMSVACDDGNASTINDMQSVLACDGVTVCGPCTGSPVDCSTGTTSIVSCDDGNDCTINDEQTILDSDGTICVPCAGVSVDCTTGVTTLVPCDDGIANTINDMQSVLACDGTTVCGPCEGIPTDCENDETMEVNCDDGDPCTYDDIQIVLVSDNSICEPCQGIELDCNTPTISETNCDDGDPCTINDVQTLLDCDGTVCTPCQGVLVDCSNGETVEMSCDDGDPLTINDVETILVCNNSVCIPCEGVINTEVFLPNIFSPNATPPNNVFAFELPSSFTNPALSIYDRWGNLVYFSEENLSWNGTYNGQYLESGVYVYVLKFTTPDDEEVVKYGDVALVL